MALTDQARAIKSQLEMMGKPSAAILDYFDTTDSPTTNGFFEYMDDQESEYNAQAQWDASQAQSPVVAGKSLTGYGQFMMMNNLRRGS